MGVRFKHFYSIDQLILLQSVEIKLLRLMIIWFLIYFLEVFNEKIIDFFCFASVVSGGL